MISRFLQNFFVDNFIFVVSTLHWESATASEPLWADSKGMNEGGMIGAPPPPSIIQAQRGPGSCSPGSSILISAASCQRQKHN